VEHIGERLVWYYIPFTDIPIPMGGLNIITVVNTVLVMAFVFALLRVGARQPQRIPGRMQYISEAFVTAFDGLVSSSLELETPKQNRAFLPLIVALFAFLLIANFWGFIPTHWFEEPTADINTTLALGVMGMVIAWYCAVRAKGFYGFFEELCGPLFAQEGGGVVGKLSALFFLPLNVVGEIAKIVSISFRLFGNIIGGAIIIIVVTTLVYNFGPLAMGLDLFFIFFVGTVQAFVFTMLTLTYIAVAIK